MSVRLAITLKLQTRSACRFAPVCVRRRQRPRDVEAQRSYLVLGYTGQPHQYEPRAATLATTHGHREIIELLGTYSLNILFLLRRLATFAMVCSTLAAPPNGGAPAAHQQPTHQTSDRLGADLVLEMRLQDRRASLDASLSLERSSGIGENLPARSLPACHSRPPCTPRHSWAPHRRINTRITASASSVDIKTQY